MKKLIKIFKENPFEVLLFLVLLSFSVVIMFKTFNAQGGDLKIASKAWSDFAATIPLVRSFSLGDNFPPQYPIFPGPPIRYHFVFFLLVGLLEKVGFRIDWALNLVSIFSFFFLGLAIYFLAKTLFKKKSVAIISVVLFILNGSFGFLEFFKVHPASINTIKEIVANTNFSSFGPYDGNIVSAFWNLNIYTNQRHLGLAYAAFLTLILIVLKASQNPKGLTFLKSLILGLAIGLFPFVHTAVFGMMGIALVIFFFLYPHLRQRIFTIGVVAALTALPQFFYMGSSQVSFPYFDPGYLIEKLTLSNFLNYWFLNLGLVVFLAPIGFLLSGSAQRKIILPFVGLFILGNLFRFSPDMATSHKFFNLFVIGINIFAAFSLTSLWKKGIFGKVLIGTAFFFMTLSGVIDLFPILNDSYVQIPDYKKSPPARFILENTPTDSIFLNLTFLYDPASLAGRKIYLGWPYFAWGAGYDTDKRHNKMRQILEGTDKDSTCRLLKEEKIDYIEIQRPSLVEGVSINYPFFDKHFENIFYDSESNTKIYGVQDSCN